QTDHTPLPNLLKEEQTRRGEVARGRVRYDSWATSAVYELLQLIEQTRAVLPQIIAPLCLINAQRDPTVNTAQTEIIAKGVSSTVIERHLLENGGHILTQDVEHRRVFDLVGTFVQGIAEQG